MNDPNDLEAMLDSTPETTAPAQTQEQTAPDPVETGDTAQHDAGPPPAVNPAPQTERTVPLKAVEDERRKRQELERKLAEYEAKLAQQQQPEPAPDWTLEPEVAAQRLQADFERRAFSLKVEMSERMVRQQHADYEEVRDAFAQAAQADPRLAQALVNHPFPAEFAYQQGKRIKMLMEIGDDPEAYIERRIAERLGQSQQPAAQAPKPQSAPVPKSLARTANTQPRDNRGRFADDGPTPLEDILG